MFQVAGLAENAQSVPDQNQAYGCKQQPFGMGRHIGKELLSGWIDVRFIN